jgi:hypothetical protein
MVKRFGAALTDKMSDGLLVVDDRATNVAIRITVTPNSVERNRAPLTGEMANGFLFHAFNYSVSFSGAIDVHRNLLFSRIRAMRHTLTSAS